MKTRQPLLVLLSILIISSCDNIAGLSFLQAKKTEIAVIKEDDAQTLLNTTVALSYNMKPVMDSTGNVYCVQEHNLYGAIFPHTKSSGYSEGTPFCTLFNDPEISHIQIVKILSVPASASISGAEEIHAIIRDSDSLADWQVRRFDLTETLIETITIPFNFASSSLDTCKEILVNPNGGFYILEAEKTTDPEGMNISSTIINILKLDKNYTVVKTQNLFTYVSEEVKNEGIGSYECMAIKPNGNIIISAWHNTAGETKPNPLVTGGGVYELSSDLAFIKSKLGAYYFSYPAALSVDSEGYLYTLNAMRSSIEIYDSDFAIIGTIPLLTWFLPTQFKSNTDSYLYMNCRNTGLDLFYNNYGSIDYKRYERK